MISPDLERWFSNQSTKNMKPTWDIGFLIARKTDLEMTLQKALAWRYATKKFNPIKKIPQDKLQKLLEALRLAPSSYGLQPWKFLILSDHKIRQDLRQVSWGQPQVTDCSHLVVLCARTDLDKVAVRQYIESISKTRNLSIDSLKQMEDRISGTVDELSEDHRIAWAQKQIYIALGFLLLAAAESGIDACPMEGFEKAAFDQILNLKSQHLTATVMCPLGYRAKDDPAAALAKVRFPSQEVFRFI